MRHLLLVLIVFQSAFATCDWSKIEKSKDGNFIYSPELHLCVGVLVENEKNRIAQIEHLNKSLELKDLAIQKTEDRAEMWRTTSYSLEDRINSQQKYSVYRDWLFFGLGTLVMGFGVYTAGHIYK